MYKRKLVDVISRNVDERTLVSFRSSFARPSFPGTRNLLVCARRPGITRRSAARTYHHIAPVANVERGGKERRTRASTRDLWYYQVKYTRRTLAGKMVSKKSRNLLRSSSHEDIVPLVFPDEHHSSRLPQFRRDDISRDDTIVAGRRKMVSILNFYLLFEERDKEIEQFRSSSSVEDGWIDVTLLSVIGEEKDTGERGAASSEEEARCIRDQRLVGISAGKFTLVSTLGSTRRRVKRARLSRFPDSLRDRSAIIHELFRNRRPMSQKSPSKTVDFARGDVVASISFRFLLYSTSDTGLTSFRTLVLRYRNNCGRGGKRRATRSRSHHEACVRVQIRRGGRGEERRGPRGDRVTRGFGSSRRARLEIESAAAARLP